MLFGGGVCENRGEREKIYSGASECARPRELVKGRGGR